MKVQIPFLELLTNRGCNLACEGCTTYSDMKHSGYNKWEDTRKKLEPWLDRLDLPAIGFMGGEPLVNPDLKNWILGVRDLLPNAQIRFVTNGFLTEQKWEIFELLRDLGNTVYKISYHILDPRLDQAVDRIKNELEWEPIYEYGIHRLYNKKYNFRFQLNKPDTFLKTFKGEYANMQPHNNDPAEAFAECVQQRCPLFYNGNLFKCGTAALTPELLKRFGNPNQKQWDPYYDAGLSIDCTDHELVAFADNFGKPHSMCRQCPTENDKGSFVDHPKTVKLLFK